MENFLSGSNLNTGPPLARIDNLSQQDQDTPLVQTQNLLIKSSLKSKDKKVIDPNDIKIEPYSDVSFALRGTGTSLFKSSIKEIGGKWGPGLQGGKGWIFSNKKIEQVKELLQNIKEGKIKPEEIDQNFPYKKKSQTNTNISQQSNISLPLSNTQTVNWILFRPRVGMKARITVNQNIVDYDVFNIEIHEGITDIAIINLPGKIDQQSKLVICSGSWRVWGYNENHKVDFY